jgi:hypothetical protein
VGAFGVAGAATAAADGGVAGAGAWFMDGAGGVCDGAAAGVGVVEEVSGSEGCGVITATK